MQHIAPGHPEVPRVDVGGDVAQRVTDMQSLTGGVREHVLDEHLVLGNGGTVSRRKRSNRVRHVERSPLPPVVLPPLFDSTRKVGVIAMRRYVGLGATGAHGVVRRGSRRVGHAPQGIGTAVKTTGRYRLRCRAVRGWFQVGSGAVSGPERCIQSVENSGLICPNSREKDSFDEKHRP